MLAIPKYPTAFAPSLFLLRPFLPSPSLNPFAGKIQFAIQGQTCRSMKSIACSSVLPDFIGIPFFHWTEVSNRSGHSRGLKSPSPGDGAGFNLWPYHLCGILLFHVPPRHPPRGTRHLTHASRPTTPRPRHLHMARGACHTAVGALHVCSVRYPHSSVNHIGHEGGQAYFLPDAWHRATDRCCSVKVW